MLDFSGGKSLGEHIGGHIIGWAINKVDLAFFNNPVNEMEWMSMCFIWTWYWWSLERVIADWLSENKVVRLTMGPKISPIRDLSHSASLAVCVVATYSLSVVDREIISCLFELQDTVPPFKMKA